MKQKGLYIFLALLIIFLMGLSACAPQAAVTEEAAAEEAVEEEAPAEEEAEVEEEAETAEEMVEEEPTTLVIAVDADITPGLDIHDAASLQTGENLGMNVFDGLIQVGEEGFAPRLAEKWEAAEDGWIFYLRDDVVFHDGTPFNAEAVKFNADRLIEGNNRQSSKWAAVESAEVIDEFTVKLVTKGPPSFALLGQLVHAGAGAMQSPTAVQNGEFPVGTGPFKLVEWKQGEALILEKNEDYWMDGPYVDRVEIKVVPEAATRVLMLEAGEADYILNVPPADAERLKDIDGITIYNPPSASWRYIGMNYQREPFNDKRVRQALNYAVDAEAISANVLKGYAKVLTSPVGSAMWSHIDIGPYPYDPDKARELLAEAGYPDGFSATLISSEGLQTEATAASLAVRQYLADVGVEIEIENMEFGVWLDRIFTPLEDNTVEMTIGSYGSADPDGLRIMLGCDEWPPQRNSTFYCNDEVDALFKEGMNETDLDKRNEIYEEIQKLVWEDAPWIFLVELSSIYAWNDSVEGLTTYPGNQNYYELRNVKVNK